MVAKKTVKETAKKAAKKPAKQLAAKGTSATANQYRIVLKPIITEKSSLVGAAGNVATFEVAVGATKTEIKDAVQNIFKVEVAKVRTVNVLGKMKRTARSVGRRANYRKAYVTLKPGQSIDVVEGL
jgi:large subunit ribosomal protein L23